MKKESKIEEYLVLRKRAIALLAKGMKQTFIAEVLGVGQSTVSQWLTAYKIKGESSLELPKMGGSKGFLSASQKENLSKLLVTKTAEDYGFEGDFWTRVRVGVLIENEFGVSYKERSVGDVLKSIGFSLQKPQKKVITKIQKK